MALKMRELCPHDVSEQDVAAHADGLCPLCLAETVNRMRTVLEAYEQLEADIILENKCWTGQNVRLTDQLYDRMIELQTMRNSILRPVNP